MRTHPSKLCTAPPSAALAGLLLLAMAGTATAGTPVADKAPILHWQITDKAGTTALYRHTHGHGVEDANRSRLNAEIKPHQSEWREWRRGLRFELASSTGRFFLALQRMKDRNRHCKRWSVALDDAAEIASHWNLGLAVDYIRVPEAEERQWALSPQLNLDLSGWLGAPGRLNARIEQAHWMGHDDKPDLPHRAWQASVRWSF